MSKEIEEMAKVMCQDAGTKNCNIQCNAHPICDVYFYAERLYKEGYRKQITGKWHKEYNTYPRYICTNCNHLFNNKSFKYCPHCGAYMGGKINEQR